MTKNDLPVAFSVSDEYFSAKDTLECGQVFRYKALSDSVYEVFSRDKYARLVSSDGKVSVCTTDGEYFWNFFDLDSDYAAKVARISTISPLMENACRFGKGIRILNQDPQEAMISFIISANNNIKRIQLIVERLCKTLGKQTDFGYAFPSVEAMASQDASFFATLGAGYRDKYLAETSAKLVGYDLNKLVDMPTDDARKELYKFKGVGPKVADCILLFGLKHGDVFPVDTWLKKVYHLYFEQGHPESAVSDYFRSIFGQDSGLCQQYLFYFQRKCRQNEINIVQYTR